jgi:threonine dehydratase
MDAPSATAILAARRRLTGRLRPTPVQRAAWLSRTTGADVWIKPECLQRTRSFKIRGALNALLELDRHRPKPTIVTASAGNHGRALAEAARETGHTCVVFAPRQAPRAKLDAVVEARAVLEAVASDYDAAEAAARDFARVHDATFISPYNHPSVVAGAGTIGLEILDELPDADAVLVPVGGGGLLAGVGLAVRPVAPDVRIVGVEAALNPVFATARSTGVVSPITVHESIADGLVGNVEAGSITIDLVERLADDLLLVTETEIADAIAALLAESGLIVEGAGAVGVAALMAGRVPAVTGKRIVVVVSGSNIDASRLVHVVRGSDGTDGEGFKG